MRKTGYMKVLKILFLILFAATALFSDAKDDSKILYEKGAALNKANKLEEAIPVLRESIKLDSDNFWAKKLLVEILVNKGEEIYNKGYQKSAYEFFKEAYRYWPNHQSVSYWMNKLRPIEANLQDKKEEVQVPKIESPVLKEEKKEETKESPKKKKKIEEDDEEEIRPSKKSKVKDSEVGAKDLLKIEERFNDKLVSILKYQRELDDSKKKDEELKRKELEEKEKTQAVFAKSESENAAAKLTANNIILFIIGITVLLGIAYIFVFRKRLGNKKIKKSEFISENTEYYREILRLYKTDEIVHKIETGELDWNTLLKYLSEMDKRIRNEVLSLVENKVKKEEPLNLSQAQLLMCLLLDGDDYIRKRSSVLLDKNFMGFLTGNKSASMNTALNKPSFQALTGPSETQNKNLGITSEIIDLKVALPLAKIADKKIFNQTHSVTSGKAVYFMAMDLGLSNADVQHYYIAGLLHDIGYFDVFSQMFNKRGKLSEEENKLMQTHPQKGVELLDFTDLPQIVYDGILYHHERWNGTGYPKKLSGEEIPLVARVIAIVDSFEAMVSPRPFRPPFSENEALIKIKEASGIFFDPTLIAPFENLVSQGLLKPEETPEAKTIIVQ